MGNHGLKLYSLDQNQFGNVVIDQGSRIELKNGKYDDKPCLKVEVYDEGKLIGDAPIGPTVEGFNGTTIGIERYALGFKTIGLEGLTIDGQDATRGYGILGKQELTYERLSLTVEALVLD